MPKEFLKIEGQEIPVETKMTIGEKSQEVIINEESMVSEDAFVDFLNEPESAEVSQQYDRVKKALEKIDVAQKQMEAKYKGTADEWVLEGKPNVADSRRMVQNFEGSFSNKSEEGYVEFGEVKEKVISVLPKYHFERGTDYKSQDRPVTFNAVFKKNGMPDYPAKFLEAYNHSTSMGPGEDGVFFDPISNSEKKFIEGGSFVSSRLGEISSIARAANIDIKEGKKVEDILSESKKRSERYKELTLQGDTETLKDLDNYELTKYQKYILENRKKKIEDSIK